ncbi:MAG: MjaI family restriction endonuclease [Rikenellaceae bacterium]
MKLKITNSEVESEVTNRDYLYPKYASQIINLANQNSQATRPRIVGQMSDLIQEFGDGSFEEWERWYLERHTKSIDVATERIVKMVENLRESIDSIDEYVIRDWVEELVIVKTYVGLRFQQAILKLIAEKKGTTYRAATAEEETKGIDGYIGEMAVSIKPTTYRAMSGLSEDIEVPIIYYEKKKSEFIVEYDF